MTALLALMMSLVLTACSTASAMNVRNAPPPASAEEPLRYAVETEVREDAECAEDGTLLASCRFELPVMQVLRPDGTRVETAQNDEEAEALAVQETFNRRFEDWDGEFREVAAAARERWEAQRERPDRPVWIIEYTTELASTVYQTDRIVSVAGEYYSFTGGAHGNTCHLSWNFDLEKGEFFEPALLSEDTDLDEAVTAELIRQANAPTESGYVPAMDYWEDYEAVMAGWSSYAVSFDAEGMTVVFSPYELASYAMGPQTFRISYGWLRPHLSGRGLELLGLESAAP